MNTEKIARPMHVERFNAILATVFGLIIAVYIGLNAVGLGGNPLSSLMRITGICLMVFSTVNPRFGLKLLIISSACLDLVKRFLVFFGIGSSADVLDVLAVAPVTLTGVFLGTCVLRPIFTKRMLDGTERRLVYFALILIAIALASGIRSSGWLTASVLGNAANKSAYSLLVPIVFVLHRRGGADEIKRLLRFTVIVFTPVAIYGIHQWIFGFNQFEADYLRSGLTTIGDTLYEDHPRPFSTLSSIHAFAVSMGIMVLLSTLICAPSLRNRAGFFASKQRWWLPVIFGIACFLSFGRGGWLVVLIGLVCMFAFRSKTRTIAFYAAFLTSFALLVWQAENIYASLEDLQAMLPIESELQDQAFRLGTYSERLFGFQNVFQNRTMWTWFGNPDIAYKAGLDQARDEIVHDALGQTLVTYGVVGLFALFSFGSLALFFLHRRILATRHGTAEILGRGLLSTCIAVFAGGMLTGGHLSVFPLNLLFWTAAGALMAATSKQPLLQEAPQASPRAPLRPPRRQQRETPLRPV